VRVFVGIDQALTKAGLCVIVDNVVEVAELIRTPTDLRGPARLTHLRDVIKNLLWPFTGKITYAAIEAQSLGSMGDLDQLGQINGVMQVMLTDLGAPPLLVPPSSLKKFVTGKPNASKDHMMRMSSAEWDYDFVQDDVCDAHGLARFAQECVEQRATTRHRVEAVYALLHPKKRRRRRSKKLALVAV